MLTSSPSAATLLIILLVAGAGCKKGAPDKPDINKVGGTILVYEAQTDGKPSRSTDELAAVVQRMIDPTDVAPVVVRAAGKNQIEVAVAREGDRKAEQELVKEIKALIAADPPQGIKLVSEKATEPK